LSLSACSMLATISLDSCASPRFCSSVVTPISLQFYRRDGCPCDGANQSAPCRIGPLLKLSKAYPQFLLKNWWRRREHHDIHPEEVEDNDRGQ
jgi:hypothetical protein